jgi:hypothetical protein
VLACAIGSAILRSVAFGDSCWLITISESLSDFCRTISPCQEKNDYYSDMDSMKCMLIAGKR